MIITKELFIEWNNIVITDININLINKDLFDNISNNLYPRMKQTLTFYLFDNNNEDDDWFFFELYKELFDVIRIFLHKKNLIPIKNINFINIFNNIYVNNCLKNVINFLY